MPTIVFGLTFHGEELMDNDHNLIVTAKGQYSYDSDFDVYRRVPDAEELTHIQQFGWIYVAVALTALCFFVTLR